MAEPIKITQEELDGFNHLKVEIQKKMFECGEMYFQKMELDSLYKELSDKEMVIRKAIGDLKQAEADMMNSILQKYGEGSLNVKDGIFTPS